MFGSTVLEVAIGIAMVYLLLSMICSAVNEFLVGLLHLRARNLRKGVANLLIDPTLTDLAGKLYRHPLLKGMARPGSKKGSLSYIPSGVFSSVLVDLLAPADPASGPKTVQDVRNGIAGLNNPEIRSALTVLLDQAEGNLQRFRETLGGWFDDGMERVSGWYKRTAGWMLMAWAIGFSIALNVDTITIANVLARDSALRAAVVSGAEEFVKRELPDSAASPTVVAREMKAQLMGLGLPVGWTTDTTDVSGRRVPDSTGEWTLKIVGLLITGVAVSLGAPFWFDLVNRFVNLRSGGPKPARGAGQPAAATPIR